MIDLTKVEEGSSSYDVTHNTKELSDDALYQQIIDTEKDMKRAAEALEFEEAALWRNQLATLKQQWNDRFGSRSHMAMKQKKSGKNRINRELKKKV